jgi:hypothetical protein
MSDNFILPKYLKAKDTYLMISFFDSALLIPEITTVVYLGKDIFNEGSQKHYFQNYESFMKKNNDMSGVELIEAAEDNLMNFYDLSGAAALLQECSQRKQA